MTRANLYSCNQFIGEIGSDAYPGGDLWKLLRQIDTQRWEHREAEQALKRFVLDHYGWDYLPPVSSGVGNWSYEYALVPIESPKNYREWEKWRTRVVGRTWNSELFPQSYWQIPGPWMTLDELKQDK